MTTLNFMALHFFFAIFNRVTRMGLHIFEILGVRKLRYQFIKRKIHGKKSCYRILIFNKWLPFHSGRTKMGSIIGHNTAEVLRSQLHIPSKKLPMYPPLGGVSNTYSSAIISILAMVPLSIFF